MGAGGTGNGRAEIVNGSDDGFLPAAPQESQDGLNLRAHAAGWELAVAGMSF